MKGYSKILMLVAVALFLILTACSRAASTPPPVATSPTGAADFPFETQDPVSAASTQTAIAAQPLPVQPTNTPEVVVATTAPEANPAPAEATATPAPATDNTQSNAPTLVPPARPVTYTLVKGEWPICIARRYDLDLNSFFSANGLNMNSKPAAGTVLQIPASGTWDSSAYGSRALKTHPATVTVASGQSVNSIACDFGDVAPEHILAANGLQNASDVQAGMTINIP